MTSFYRLNFAKNSTVLQAEYQTPVSSAPSREVDTAHHNHLSRRADKKHDLAHRLPQSGLSHLVPRSVAIVGVNCCMAFLTSSLYIAHWSALCRAVT